MHPVKYIGLVVFTTLLMGIAFPIGKIGLQFAPPFFLMGIRYVLAGGLLALVTAGRPQPRGLRQWLQAALIGCLQTAGLMGCVYFSMRYITSSESAIITFTNPFLVIVFGTLFGGAAYRIRQWLGVAAGIVGVAVTFGLRLDIGPGTLICFAGAACFAAATLMIKRWGARFDTTVLAAYQMLAGGAALFILSAIAEQPTFQVNPTSVTVLLILVILCSIVQFSLWFYLLRSGDPAKTSSYLFLAPFFGVLSSWLLLGERIEWYVGAGGVLICAGIYLVNNEGRRRNRKGSRFALRHSDGSKGKEACPEA